MKKNRKTALMAAVLTGAVMLTGCDHGHDDVVTVYGPPVTTAASTEEQTTEAQTTEPAATTYNPSDDDVQVEYGAPIVQDDTTKPDTTEYDPANDNVQIVYGPPESFGSNPVQ